MSVRMLRGRVIAVSLSLSLGLLAGTGAIYVAAAKDRSVPDGGVEAFAAGDYQAPLEPARTLKNGMTVGSFRAETPLDERPDFLEVTLKDGRTALVKVSDTFAIPVIPLDRKGPIHLTDEEMAQITRQNDRVTSRANSEGEIWVEAYGADGVTVIGQFLIGHR